MITKCNNSHIFIENKIHIILKMKDHTAQTLKLILLTM